MGEPALFYLERSNSFVIDEWVSGLCFVGSYSVQLPKRCDRVQCGLCFSFLFVQFDDAFTLVGICIVKHGCASGTPGMPSQRRFSSLEIQDGKPKSYECEQLRR